MKAIVTVVGKDKSGIIAGVSQALATNGVNIEDISQTTLQDNFTMIMLCGFDGEKLSIDKLSKIMNETGDKIGVSIHVQHEDIFNAMHKI